MSVPAGWPEDVSPYDALAAQTDQPRAAVLGNEVGFAVSLCEGGRASERCAARRRRVESGDGSNQSARNRGAVRAGVGREQHCLFDRTREDWEQQGLPDGPITVGIDGGYVRAAHKEGWFEVIAGKSVVAFRREAEDETPSAKCFGFVQTYDDKPRRRLWELMKSQGMKENQQVVFMSDGGETVRRLQEYLHPCSEHVIDWFSHHHAID